ncbi:mechanosensitive ion channel protein [Leptolyngbya sp. Heron Island J]|uniref:mechanosensitive ion channel family protein n=1 Tax=Leptolyngbya sp. Heron Island J TaxID=1385935 RepID=UPI0003B94EB8|nr:mechanosensitive ion channel domain-containing protein [Leptolyngbya sp. Heron Island J]ESA37100.1 mechanosensitive ion channel protein [Leptolyngbya sp. Heron Island J]
MESLLGQLELFSNLFEQLQQVGLALGLNIGVAIAIFFVGRWVAQFLRRFVRKTLGKTRIDPTLVAFASNMSYYVVMAFVLLAILGQLGIETTSLIALIGAAGLAVGLSLQGSLANFAAGILLIIFRPFRVGDWIDASGVSGYVEDIELLTTILHTLDNRTVVIPNRKLTDDNIINYSTRGTLRLDLVVGVAYDSDLKQVKTIIRQVLSEDERILSQPAPTVGVLELADSSINLAVRPWVSTADYVPVSLSIYEAIKIRFDEIGIEIPFPQRDLHVYGLSRE